MKKGKPRHGTTLKRNCGHALSEEVLKAISELPQIKSKEWTKSYLSEQIWRNFLGLPSDYDNGDLERIREGRVIV